MAANKNRVIVDIDNTLWDFASALWKKTVHLGFPDPSEWHGDFYKRYITFEQLMQYVDEIHAEQGGGHLPFPDSAGFLSSLRKNGCHITIASHRNPNKKTITENWLRIHGLVYDDLYVGPDKTVLFDSHHAIVDDDPGTLDKAASKGLTATGLKFAWNRNSNHPLFSSLTEVLAYFNTSHFCPHIQYRKANPDDFEGILRLQHENLITTLPQKDLSQGFLTIPLSREYLYRINNEHGIFAACQGREIVGYLMAQSVEIAMESPLIVHMLNRLKECRLDGIPVSSRKLFVYGPVCIDKRYRGQKVLDKLFALMLQTLQGQRDVGIAFVSENNPRSFHAHTGRLGMQVADEFEFKGQQYHTLVFSVL